MPEYIKNISKKYKDYEKIIVYKHAWTPSLPTRRKKRKSNKEQTKDLRNVARARTAIHDIVACNTFDYFATLTIAPDASIDRYNYDDCARKLSKWLNNHLEKYLLVPEKHKDGALHFHLLADIPEEKLTKYKGSVYNIKSYKYGYSTAIKIKTGSEARIANYMRKYITKDLLTTVGHGRRRYWCSYNLVRPTVEYNQPIPPEAVKKYSMEYLDIYEVSIDNT